MNSPCHIAVDKHDRVMVADLGNVRVVLLSPTLTHLGYVITITGHHLNTPYALHLDELKHLLYIGEHGGGRQFVLDVAQVGKD